MIWRPVGSGTILDAQRRVRCCICNHVKGVLFATLREVRVCGARSCVARTRWWQCQVGRREALLGWWPRSWVFYRNVCVVSAAIVPKTCVGGPCTICNKSACVLYCCCPPRRPGGPPPVGGGGGVCWRWVGRQGGGKAVVASARVCVDERGGRFAASPPCACLCRRYRRSGEAVGHTWRAAHWLTTFPMGAVRVGRRRGGDAAFRCDLPSHRLEQRQRQQQR